MKVTQIELAAFFGVCTRSVYRKIKDNGIKYSNGGYDVREMMIAWYGEDWRYYYHKYLGKKIEELTELMLMED